MTNEERKVIEEVIRKMDSCEERVIEEVSEILKNLLKEQKSQEEVVTDYIRRIGMPTHLKGYYYVREAIVIVVNEPEMLEAVMKELYPRIAKKFKTTWNKVEKGIRSCIEVTWEKGNKKEIEELFQYTICNKKGKPTNSEFIALIADEIQLKHR